jgi:hypothetical protein
MRRFQASTSIPAAIGVAVATAGLLPFSGCIYHPRDEVNLAQLFDAPTTSLTDSAETIVFEEPDRLQVTHGKGCARMENKAGALRVQQSHRLPTYATDGTVFLNGSDAR